MIRFRMFLLGLLALMLAAFIAVEIRRAVAQPPAANASSSASKEEADIRALLDRVSTAIRAKDTDAIMSAYAPDLEAFDLVPPLQIGRDAYKENYQKFFDQFQAPIEFEIRALKITAGSDVAFSHCLQRVGGVTKTGDKMQLWLRVTTGYRKINGKWLITHDHASVPIDMETGKAELELQP